MAGDPRSDVFDVVGVRGVLSGGFAVRGPWVSRTNTIEAPLKLAVMVRGRSRLSTDGVPGPVELEPSDVAVLNGRSWLEMHGCSGARPGRVAGFGFSHLNDERRLDVVEQLIPLAQDAGMPGCH